MRGYKDGCVSAADAGCEQLWANGSIEESIEAQEVTSILLHKNAFILIPNLGGGLEADINTEICVRHRQHDTKGIVTIDFLSLISTELGVPQQADTFLA